MKKIAIETSDFPTLITNNYQYVDKTHFIYQLTSRKYFFLSRPRRFGKSLLISTLNSLYLGKKELFNNLWISSSDYAWQEYPIIRLDFSSFGSASAEELSHRITLDLVGIGERYGITISPSEGPEFALKRLVEALSKKNKVVILIDEYDYPILKHIENFEEAAKQQKVLQGFYTTIKSIDSYLQFVFITGITKFTKTSLFSGLNNLIDISMDPQYGQMLGYTEEEIKKNFQPALEKNSRSLGLSEQDIVQKMQQWYNGYRFTKHTDSVYNPFSVSYFLERGEFNNYWFESATPSFLLHLIKKHDYDIQDLRDIKLSPEEMASFNIEQLPFIPLLLQTGYLTITGYDAETDVYTLNYANKEVEISFLTYLLNDYASVSHAASKSTAIKLIQALAENNLNLFFELLHNFIATIPYDIQLPLERYYQTIFYIITTLLGMRVDVEVTTNTGRIDAVIITKKYIYIIEFKINGSSAQALTQIEDKKYYEKYVNTGKKITLIGANFETKTKNITPDWAVKIL